MSGPITTQVSGAVGALVAGTAISLPRRIQLGLVTALVKYQNPLAQVVVFDVATTPKRAQRALAMHMMEQSGLRDPRSMGGPAREVLRQGGVPNTGRLMRFPWVVVADINHMTLVRTLNLSKAAMKGQARRAYTAHELQALLRTQSRMVGSQMSAPLAGGVAGLILMAVNLGYVYKEVKASTGRDQTLKVANFGAGVVGMVGATLETVGKAGEQLPWLSQKLKKPMGRWMGGAKTRAAAIQAAGRWLTGPAGVILGGLQIYEGMENFGVDSGYGYVLIATGMFSALSAWLFFASSMVPIAFFFAVLAAVLAIVAAWLKPDQIEYWLNKARHFGRNSKGSFDSLNAQAEAITALRS